MPSDNKTMLGSMAAGSIPEVTEEQRSKVRSHCANQAHTPEERNLFSQMLLGEDFDATPESA